jgi:hypothetical protein
LDPKTKLAACALLFAWVLISFVLSGGTSKTQSPTLLTRSETNRVLGQVGDVPP